MPPQVLDRWCESCCVICQTRATSVNAQWPLRSNSSPLNSPPSSAMAGKLVEEQGRSKKGSRPSQKQFRGGREGIFVAVTQAKDLSPLPSLKPPMESLRPTSAKWVLSAYFQRAPLGTRQPMGSLSHFYFPLLGCLVLSLTPPHRA